MGKYIPLVPPDQPDAIPRYLDDEMRRLSVAYVALADLPVIEVTISNGSTTTAINDDRITNDTVAVPIPDNANTAGLGIFNSSVTRGTVTLGHSDPGTDETIKVVLVIPHDPEQ